MIDVELGKMGGSYISMATHGTVLIGPEGFGS
jgi:hypothetical protein